MPSTSLSHKDATHSGGMGVSNVAATANDSLSGSSSSPSSSTPSAASGATGNGPTGSGSSSPRIDRGVRTRTHDRITLQLSALTGETTESTGITSSSSSPRPGATGDRGWRSPHGEPYRPLGNPELSLKFTPRLPSDSPSRSRTFQDSNPTAKDSTGGQREPSRVGNSQSSPQQQQQQPTQETVLSMFPRNLRKRPPEDRQLKLALRLQESMAQYSPDKVRSLRRANPITITRVDANGKPIDDRDADVDAEEDEDMNLHAALRHLQQQHLHNQAIRDKAAGAGGACSSSCSFSVSSCTSASAASLSPSRSPPRFHVDHGDTSVHLLRGAVQQGVSRLRLARNGQHFLDAVPSVEAPELTALKRQYDVARVKFLTEQETRRKLGPSAPRLLASKTTHADDSDDTGDHDASSRGTRQPFQSPQTHGGHKTATAPLAYLPYTTRLPQASPHVALPTLAEFKAKVREERMPQRLLLSSRASLASMAPCSPSGGATQRNSTARQSRVGSILLSSSSSPSPSSPEKHTTPAPPLHVSSPASPSSSSACASPSPPPAKLSRIHSRRGSVVLSTAAGEQGQKTTRLSVLGTADSDALVRMVAQLASGGAVSPRAAHSVVRLQETVDAMESSKHSQCETLAKTLSLLDHDRRECLTVKYRHFHLDTDAEHDISVMRDTAESDRVVCAQTNLARYHWYADLLRNMLANRESSSSSSSSTSSSSATASSSSASSQNNPLHPAELFCIEVIRHVASEGHAFESEQLFYLIQQLHPEDVVVHEVQQILTFLRRVLRIPLSEWKKKKQLRMAKLRTVITLNHVLKRLTTPTIIPPPLAAVGLDE